MAQLRILLINVHSSCNSGDAALTQAAIDQLRDNFPDCQISLLMNDPQSHSGPEPARRAFLPWVQKPGSNQMARFIFLVITSLAAIFTHCWLRRAFFLPGSNEFRAGLQAFLQADLVVGTPGGYLYSYGKGRALIIMLFTMTIAILAGKPLYLLPQSYGPFRFRREKWLTRWVIPRARVILAREQVSVEHLKACGIPASRCLVLPDMAFAFKPEDSEAAIEWLQGQGIDPQQDRPLLGITAMDWGAQFPGYDHQKQYESALSGALRAFITNYGGKAIFLPQSWGPSQNEDDRLPAARIATQFLDLSGSVVVVNSPLAPGLLKAVFGQMDLFIGTRMHSNIFALSQAVPVIAIGYLHKTQGIAQLVGIQDWVLDIHQISESSLISLLDDLWANRQRVRNYLEVKMPEIVLETRRAGRIIAEDYNNYVKGRLYES